MRRGRKGFTFLELLISAGLIIVAFTGLVSAYMRYNEMAETTKNANLALSAIQEQLETMRKTTLSDSVPVSYFTASGPLANASLGRITMDAINVTPNSTIYRVDADMCWKQGSRIIGPCSESNGTLTFSSPNVNGSSSAPVQVTTLMFQR